MTWLIVRIGWIMYSIRNGNLRQYALLTRKHVVSISLARSSSQILLSLSNKTLNPWTWVTFYLWLRCKTAPQWRIVCYFGVQGSGNSIAVWKNGIEWENFVTEMIKHRNCTLYINCLTAIRTESCFLIDFLAQVLNTYSWLHLCQGSCNCRWRRECLIRYRIIIG